MLSKDVDLLAEKTAVAEARATLAQVLRVGPLASARDLRVGVERVKCEMSGMPARDAIGMIALDPTPARAPTARRPTRSPIQ